MPPPGWSPQKPTPIDSKRSGPRVIGSWIGGGSRPAFGRGGAVGGWPAVLRRRRVFLCLTHDRRFAYVEWLLRVWISDLRGSRGEGLDRAESSRSVRPKVQ